MNPWLGGILVGSATGACFCAGLVARGRRKDMIAARTCILCSEPALLWLNGDPYCVDHVDDAWRFVARGEAIAHGTDPDAAERLVGDMLREAFREMGEG